MIYYTECDTETEAIGRELAKRIDAAGLKRCVIAMRGEMGVGKTAFTRGFASYFGVDGVRSPTFTVVNEYKGKARIYHFDMYRISDGDDLYSIGYDDYIESDGFSIIEWSENIEEYLPSDAINVRISRCPEGELKREIFIDYEGCGI